MSRRIPAVATCLVLVAALGACPAGTALAKKAPKKIISATPVVFSGIPWMTAGDSVRAVLVARGYQVPKPVPGQSEGPDSLPASLLYQGSFFERQALVEGYLDERGRVVRFVITLAANMPGYRFPTQRKLYDEIVAEGEKKYGLRTDWRESYNFPYEKGDGREDDALAQGGLLLRSLWEDRAGDALQVEMDRQTGVVLTYACPGWDEYRLRMRGKRARDL